MYDKKRMSFFFYYLVLTVLVWNIFGYEFVSSYIAGEVRCVEREREALLRFKKDLIIDRFNLLSSWGSEDHKKECCEWEGVRCGNTTGHVTALVLSYLSFRNISSGCSALLDLHHLEDLDLSGNDFGMNRIFPKFICSMKQLQHLSLGHSRISGIIPPQLGNLSNLQTLDLSGNDFGNSKIPEFIGSMKNLEHLSLGYSNFSGIVPHQLGNLTNLKTLDLSWNYLLIIDNLNWLSYSHLPFLSRIDFFDVNINDPNWLQYVLNLPFLREISLENCGLIKPSLSVNFSSSTPSLASSLRELDLRDNKLRTLPSSIWQLPKLEYLDVSSNLLEGTNLTNPHNLRELNLSSNKLKRLPSSIWKLHKLETLDVSFNLLEGTITEANFTNLHNLKHLDLSFNSLILRVDPNWTPPFQLDLIHLGCCDMGPHFPLWFRTQSNLGSIDLSLTGLKDEVPKWFWDLSLGQNYLNLSHNHLSGIIPHFSTHLFYVIDVSSNDFSGPIPLFHTNIIILQLSQNMFSGSISSAFCALQSPNIFLIDLSNNKLVGELPKCLENINILSILNLANNSFSGEIPRALGSLSQLTTLQLGNNNLSGELPSTLKNCKKLQLIDVGGNMLTGNIPTWIGAVSHERMAILIFRNNRFEGSIPPQICSLTHIRVLDLSGNHLSGKIPPCFNNFTFLVQMNTTISAFSEFISSYIGNAGQYVESAIVSWKGQDFEYRKNLEFLKLVDISSNRLVGDIPRSLFSLRGLISLNLSRNSLTGIIHPDIGEMKMLEALDLSSNQLSGAIPIGMAQLHFLEVLDFANNNLSGKIPIGGQLHTFNASSYVGNSAGLCGSPLPLCPGESSDPSVNNKAEDVVDDGILSFPFLKGLVISIILGFIIGFWGVVGSLVVKVSWRRAYFDLWDAVGNWLYVTTAIFWAKLIQRS